MQTSTQHKTANPEQIARAAYQLWEQAGKPTGRDMEFWLKAERQISVTSRTSANPANTSDSPSKQRSQPSAAAKLNTAVDLKSRQPIPDAGKQATTPATDLVPPREKRPSPNAAARAR
jgi:hypothetical protein